MKKSTIALALSTILGTGAASAAVVSFSGTFTMYDPTGAVVGGSGVVLGSFDTNGAGGSLTSPTGFFGFAWSAHDISSTTNGDGTVSSGMLFDWGASINIPVNVLWDGTGGPGNVWSATDGDSDGIPGIAMTAGPFTGFSPYFSGAVTVPVPAAAWLFGSGLAGLVGVARRRRKVQAVS